MKKPSSVLALVLAGLLLYCIPVPPQAEANSTPSEILRLTGNSCGLFGFSTARVGDLNGDGYQDFAVSEPFNGRPRISIYWGGTIADSVADLHLRPGNPTDDALFGALI